MNAEGLAQRGRLSLAQRRELGGGLGNRAGVLAQLDCARVVAGDVDRSGVPGVTEGLGHGLNGSRGWRPTWGSDALNEPTRPLGGKGLDS